MIWQVMPEQMDYLQNILRKINLITKQTNKCGNDSLQIVIVTWITIYITITVHFINSTFIYLKGMEHVPNIFMSFDKYLFIEVINILI